MGHPRYCPHCNFDMRGKEIPDEHKQYYAGDGFYSECIGIEVRGYYDGVAYWRCPYCEYTWARFPWVPAFEELMKKCDENGIYNEN